MDSKQRVPDRRALLAFVEAHWRDLTLRDARAISVENFAALAKATTTDVSSPVS